MPKPKAKTKVKAKVMAKAQVKTKAKTAAKTKAKTKAKTQIGTTSKALKRRRSKTLPGPVGQETITIGDGSLTIKTSGTGAPAWVTDANCASIKRGMNKAVYSVDFNGLLGNPTTFDILIRLDKPGANNPVRALHVTMSAAGELTVASNDGSGLFCNNGGPLYFDSKDGLTYTAKGTDAAKIGVADYDYNAYNKKLGNPKAKGNLFTIIIGQP